jgi:hypothetical protein
MYKYKNLNHIDDFPVFLSIAKRPLQFLANWISSEEIMPNIPIPLESSSSAYQLFSYLLLDVRLAELTNLRKIGEGSIYDIFEEMVSEFKSFMKAEPDNFLESQVLDHLTGKLFKEFFHPESLISTVALDLKVKKHLTHLLTQDECTKWVSKIINFRKTQYEGIECLINIISSIGWMASEIEKPVTNIGPYFIRSNYTFSKKFLYIR